MADDEETGYRWETEYEKTWEALVEDESGSLQASISDIVSRAKRRHLLDKEVNVRLGMMRHLFLIVDMSAAMSDQDLKPTRILTSLKLLETYIEEYFDQNPISQLGILVTCNKRAEKVTELGGNPRRHITALQGLTEKPCQGELSLQNSLELALQTLRHMPGHASREILVIVGSLTTCDPSDIYTTLKSLQEHNVRCSVIGLSAEVRVCKKLCQMTNGQYGVILDESHFKDLLKQHVSPPPATANTESSLIKMGFPHHSLRGDQNSDEKASMCMCHLDKPGSQGFGSNGYFCPQCKSKYCELPIECKACGLTLVSAPHLARSYHHLFPPPFTERLTSEMEDVASPVCCFGCQVEIVEPQVYQCEKCQQLFCLDCDLFTHHTLHSCPGCAGKVHASHGPDMPLP
ncbi:hypothetical protein ACOMHN_010170 [Nucella lapillus]